MIDIISLLAIALGLSMDAFAVAISVGVTLKKISSRQFFRLSFHFGLFQAFMPIIGWFSGLTVQNIVQSYANWIVFILLSFIGGKMIYEAFQGEKEECTSDPTKGLSLVFLSVATSIDALAVGFSLALLKVHIWFPSLVIGLTTLSITVLGMSFGKRAGTFLGKKVGIVGGVILIIIGLKILIGYLLHK